MTWLNSFDEIEKLSTLFIFDSWKYYNLKQMQVFSLNLFIYCNTLDPGEDEAPGTQGTRGNRKGDELPEARSLVSESLCLY